MCSRKLEINYEHTYGHNELKEVTISEIDSLIPPGLSVLDVYCGTGRPEMRILASSGLEVVGCDISPKMLCIASDRIPDGAFIVSDMLEYQPEGQFAAVLVIPSEHIIAKRLDEQPLTPPKPIPKGYNYLQKNMIFMMAWGAEEATYPNLLYMDRMTPTAALASQR